MNDTPPVPEYLRALCRRAFAESGMQAFWNKRVLEVTREDGLVIPEPTQEIDYEKSPDAQLLVLSQPDV